MWSAQQHDIFAWFAAMDAARRATAPNLIVRARAGTGKTTTIIEGITHAPEQSIMLCAFNKRIAEELQGRIKNPHAQAKTLHALGFAAVNRYWERIGLAKGSDRADSLAEYVCGPRAPDAIKRLVSKLHSKGREIAPHATQSHELRDIAIDFELMPDEQWQGTAYDGDYVLMRALEAMERAATVKPTGMGIDFADMIFLPVRNHWLSPSVDLVVVDEAQDMTVAQLEIARGICKGRICIVGDDRQAIYGFRGADSESLDRLKGELQADELKLTVTYRCGTAIVAEAQRLVPDFVAAETNPAGEVLTLPSSKLTAEAGPGDFILSRLNAPLVSVAMTLLRMGKRTRIAGRDIGAGLKTLIRKLKGRSIPHLLERIAAWEKKEVDKMLKAKREDRVEGIHDQAEMLIALTSTAKSVADVETLIDGLFTDDGTGVAGMITCSSVHKAKGLEADRVFMLTKTFRESQDIEEQNIRYVAITRAKRTLVYITEEKHS